MEMKGEISRDTIKRKVENRKENWRTNCLLEQGMGEKRRRDPDCGKKEKRGEMPDRKKCERGE